MVVKYDYKYLTEYCNQYNIILNKDYSKDKVNRETIIEAKCVYTNCLEKLEKKLRDLCRVGCYCRTHVKILRIEKVKQTNIKKFGVEYPAQNKEVREKMKATTFKNYGVFNASQSDTIKAKKVESCLKNYGCENPMHNTEIVIKLSKNAYKLKEYILPSGKIIKVQGYEPFALNELITIDNITEDDIITGCGNVPKIIYYDEEQKEHHHYVDIYIPSQNKMIEVKSTWTAEKKKDCIFLKQNACKEQGYLYEIWVYNDKGKKIECYK